MSLFHLSIKSSILTVLFLNRVKLFITLNPIIIFEFLISTNFQEVGFYQTVVFLITRV